MFEVNAQAGQHVVIVTDTAHDPLVWQAVATCVHELGATPSVMLFPPRPADYLDPPEPVVEAMTRADLVVLVATTGMFHSPAGHRTMGAGVPTIVMDGGITADMLTRGGVTADYQQMLRTRYALGKRLEGARMARLRSSLGTDVTYSVEGRIFVPKEPDGSRHPLKVFRRAEEGRKGSPLYGVVFPGLEFNIPPVEGTANGVIVVDTTLHQIGLLQQPIRFAVHQGRIKSIEGGYQARELEEYIRRFGDENAWHMPVEASIGLNPEARITGVQREDKNILGAIHVALGRNDDIGGTIYSKLHLDGVILRPTLEVDGRLIIEDGRLIGV
ncbi:MAG: hypothetical protein HYV93_08905 [Candidatus Rokubacteria bacterium]|nr:hypothetical protein [Candidatus Rokubacteria bacterium]